jgi:hypothetical protein
VPVLLRGQFSDSVRVSWSSCCRAKFPFFLCSHFLQLPWSVVRFSLHSSAAGPIFFSFNSAAAHITRSRPSLHDLVSLLHEFTGPELAPSPAPVGASRSFWSPVLASGARPGSFSIGPGQTSVSHQRFNVLSSEILIFDRLCVICCRISSRSFS